MNSVFRSWPEAAIGFAENYANRIAALRAEAAIGPTELSIAASDPKPLLVNVRNLNTILAIGCKYSVVAGEVDSWLGYQCDQLGNDKSAGQTICTTEGRPAGVRHKDVPNEL